MKKQTEEASHLTGIKQEIKKLIGRIFKYWYCEYCGEPLEDYGYNFHQRCSDKDCISRSGGAIGRFYE